MGYTDESVQRRKENDGHVIRWRDHGKNRKEKKMIFAKTNLYTDENREEPFHLERAGFLLGGIQIIRTRTQ